MAAICRAWAHFPCAAQPRAYQYRPLGKIRFLGRLAFVRFQERRSEGFSRLVLPRPDKLQACQRRQLGTLLVRIELVGHQRQVPTFAVCEELAAHLLNRFCSCLRGIDQADSLADMSICLIPIEAKAPQIGSRVAAQIDLGNCKIN